MAKLFDLTLEVVDGIDPVDVYEEEAVPVDQLGDAMQQLIETAFDEYNPTDFKFSFSFSR